MEVKWVSKLDGGFPGYWCAIFCNRAIATAPVLFERPNEGLDYALLRYLRAWLEPIYASGPVLTGTALLYSEGYGVVRTLINCEYTPEGAVLKSLLRLNIAPASAFRGA